MTNKSKLIFVDCEATGPAIGVGELTSFGAVDYQTRKTFYGVLYEAVTSENPVMTRITGEKFNEYEVFLNFELWLHTIGEGPYIFVTDNLAYDWQWINHGFWNTRQYNPFGFNGRSISDLCAGLNFDYNKSKIWKDLRVTEHTHHPVDDAMGNVEAFETLVKIHGLMNIYR